MIAALLALAGVLAALALVDAVGAAVARSAHITREAAQEPADGSEAEGAR